MTKALDQNYNSFMRMNVGKYTDSWIALVGGKVIAEDKSFKKAYLHAKEVASKEKPLFVKIPGKKVMIL